MTLVWLQRRVPRDLAGLSFALPSTKSWCVEIDGKRFSGMIEIDVKVHCYVLLENHFHLVATKGLIEEIEDPFEAFKWQQVFGGAGTDLRLV
jgi:hypothetical protein